MSNCKLIASAALDSILGIVLGFLGSIKICDECEHFTLDPTADGDPMHCRRTGRHVHEMGSCKQWTAKMRR